jgi:preprotein translocase subunit SecF
MALKIVPDDINLAFVKHRRIFFAFSGVLFILAIASTFLTGLNFGIDFKGGILIEVRNKSGPADIAEMRSRLNALGLGEVSLQTFGEPNDVLIRVEKQSGGDKAQTEAIRRIKDVFSYLATAKGVEPKFTRGQPMVLKGKLNRPGTTVATIERSIAKLSLSGVTVSGDAATGAVEIVIPPQYSDSDTENAAIDKQNQALHRIRDALSTVTYRRTEFVGPQVGEELIMSGIWAVVLALVGILLYVWFRFEWQFGAAAILALTHDILLTLGFFAELQLEFNLSTVAAVLTIAGYSINDTVVVFDRVRENLRKYKKMPLPELMNKSINETLSRTVLTSFTTILAVLALVILGGQVIRDFSMALVWGIVIGTYSSICLAVPILLYFNIRRDTFTEVAPEAEGEAPAE